MEYCAESCPGIKQLLSVVSLFAILFQMNHQGSSNSILFWEICNILLNDEHNSFKVRIVTGLKVAN